MKRNKKPSAEEMINAKLSEWGYTEEELVAHAAEAEKIKSKAYDIYYLYGKTLDERVNGLRTVLRCHFIKFFCGLLVHALDPEKYYEFKKEWIEKNQHFDQEVLRRI